LAQPRIARSPALVDVCDQKSGRLGASQVGGAEQVQQREVALALAGAAVGHAQQSRPPVVGERPRLAPADALRAHRAQLLGLNAECLG
jgi:hypothetical protein